MVDNSGFNAPATGGNRGTKLHFLVAMLVLVLGIGLGLPCSCWAGGIIGAHQLREGPHILCGQALTDAVDLACVNGYNTIPKKRMNVAQMGMAGEAMEEEEETEAEAAEQQLPHTATGYALSPLLSSFYGTEVLIKTRRQRRHHGGIYDECCRKPCSYNELLAYCRQK